MSIDPLDFEAMSPFLKTALAPRFQLNRRKWDLKPGGLRITKCHPEGEEELWFSFHLGKSCKNLMIKEEVWFGLSWEKLVKNELVLNHAPPQVYRAISLLLAFGRCNTQS